MIENDSKIIYLGGIADTATVGAPLRMNLWFWSLFFFFFFLFNSMLKKKQEYIGPMLMS